MCFGGNIYFWKQTLVVSSGFFHSAATSFMLTFPAVLNPAILSPNATDIKATSDQASWIAASNGISGVISFAINSFIMDKYGRKVDFIILNVCLIVSWIIFIFANNVATLIIARVIQGLAAGGLFINTLIVSEYSHPTRRGYFSSLKRASGAIGTLICHGLTLTCTWREIAGIAIAPAFVSLIITLFWPESPSFLALKGRFEECEKSFVWLHGSSVHSQRELKELVAAQKEKQENEVTVKFWKQMKDRTFLKSLFIVALLTIVVDAAGKYYFVAYVIQIMKEITGDTYVATYCSLGGDVFSIIALLSSCFVIKMFKRRTLLFVLGGFSISLMFVIGFISLFKSGSVWLIPSIMLLHYFIVNLSVIPVCFTLFGELFPLKLRGLGCCLSGMVLTLFYAVTMKLTPILMKYTGVGGTYGTYGLCISLCFVVLYFSLPETKDKTLQEIEDELSGTRREVFEVKPMLENKS